MGPDDHPAHATAWATHNACISHVIEKMIMSDIWTTADYQHYLRTGQAPGTPSASRVVAVTGAALKHPKYRSKLEEAWAEVLSCRQMAGEIVRWYHEPVSLKIAPSCRYTPDFLSLLPDARVLFMETKGWMREAARVRLHVAATHYPHWEFWLITRPDGIWHEERIPA